MIYNVNQTSPKVIYPITTFDLLSSSLSVLSLPCFIMFSIEHLPPVFLIVRRQIITYPRAIITMTSNDVIFSKKPFHG